MNPPKRSPRIRVTNLNLRKAAERLLGQNLVSVECEYVHRMLGASATQEEIDHQVTSVRSLPWGSIVVPD